MTADLPSDSLEFSVHFSDAERDNGSPSEANLAKAIDLFARNGFVRLDNVFHPEQMQTWTRFYQRRYDKPLAQTTKADKRPLFTVDVEGPLNDPLLYANPLIFPFIQHNVGKECIVGAMSSVLSFPGAPDQFLHRDSLPIFGDDYTVDMAIPPYAITMLIPLVDCTKLTGCTKVWPGSHLRENPNEAEERPPLEPEVGVGSVLFTNSKLLHRGGANLSDIKRPLIYLTYHRKWFRDYWGYESRPPINIPRRELKKMPAQYRAMFTWTRDPYSVIRMKNALKEMLPSGLLTRWQRLTRR